MNPNMWAWMPSECGDASPASGPDVTAQGDFPEEWDEHEYEALCMLAFRDGEGEGCEDLG